LYEAVDRYGIAEPSRLQRSLWMRLDGLLRPRTLEPFLRCHAGGFEILDLEQGTRRWGFRRRSVAQAPHGAAGISEGTSSVATGVSAGVSAPLAATAPTLPRAGLGTALAAYYDQADPMVGGGGGR
jgi:hypothetical protein